MKNMDHQQKLKCMERLYSKYGVWLCLGVDSWSEERDYAKSIFMIKFMEQQWGGLKYSHNYWKFYLRLYNWLIATTVANEGYLLLPYC